MIEKERRD